MDKLEFQGEDEVGFFFAPFLFHLASFFCMEMPASILSGQN